MDIVSDILGKLDGVIKTAGETLFSGMSGGLSGAFIMVITLMIIFFGLAMSAGMKHVGGSEIFAFCVRAGFICFFGLSWANFEIVYDAIANMSSAMSEGFFDVAGKAAASNAAAAMDLFSNQTREVTDSVISAQGAIARGVLGAVTYVALVILMAVYVLVVGLAKIIIAVCLGVAPLAIMMTAFQRTQNMFETWASTFIAYMMQPVAAAGVAGTIVVTANSIFEDETDTSGLAGVTAFMVIMVVGIFALTKIPQVAHGLTGQFNLASITPGALSAGGKALAAPFAAIGGVGVRGFDALRSARASRPEDRPPPAGPGLPQNPPALMITDQSLQARAKRRTQQQEARSSITAARDKKR